MSEEPKGAIDNVAREKADRAIKTIDQLREEVSAGFSKIFRRLDEDQRFTIQSSGARTSIVVTSAIGLIALGFTFTAIITQPLRDGIKQLNEIQLHRLQELPDHHEEIGKQMAMTDQNAKCLSLMMDSLHENNKETWMMNGRLEELRKQLNQVDMGGSRKWNNIGPPQLAR